MATSTKHLQFGQIDRRAFVLDGLAALGLSEKDLLAIERENALRLMPRYA